VPVAALGFVVALFLKQVRLRDSARAGSSDMGEGFARPPAGDSQRLLEAAVGRIVGRTEQDTARRVVAASDTRLDIAAAWAVMQVELFTRMVGHGSLTLIAARRRMPPEVLVPVFDRMVEEGCLTRDGTLFSHTEAGVREARVISAAWGDWLRQGLEEDYGRPVDGDLCAAVDTIARRLLREDLTHGLPVRERESVPSGATATAG
jgi:hypothetical protein